ncbi:uncharacterized protein LOC125551685 [Triticum urartu]|uniref:uncharacterized protein LOC125543747 n=1 Tax=Triticum urartu TaxID=4572 RepID=UPI002043C1EE|nr:uncharacterized protein LOC125543747 [Triticum urartu]XP_048570930.1 uncharacterized protein LOC125551685 [Triticum urartu]
MESPGTAPVDRRATLSGERVSSGDRWLSSESESSARSYRDVALTPPAPTTSPVPEAPGRVALVARVPARQRLGPRSEVHRVSGGAVLDADGFQQPRRRNRHRRPRQDGTPSSSPPRRRSPSPEEVAGLCFRCLDHRHRVRDCTNDVRCRRCLASGHESRDCDSRRHGDARPPRVAPGRDGPPPAPTARRRTPSPPAPPALPQLVQAPPPRPDIPVRVIMVQSTEMEEAERVLGRAMVASITGNRPQVTTTEVAELLYRSLELSEGDFTVHEHHPEDFLILFSSLDTMRQLNGKHFISSPRFALSLRPWCKLAHAGAGVFEYRVELELRDIPAQAWHLSTAEHVLGESCWIERLHPRTRSRENLAIFRLSGRVHNPADVRRAAILEIVELLPSRVPSEAPVVRTLTYPISIALVRAAPLGAPTPGAQANNDDPGRDGAGNGHGQGQGSGPGRA